jgi:hypothetical protein
MAIVLTSLPTPRFFWPKRLYSAPYLFQYTTQEYVKLLSKDLAREDRVLVLLRAKKGLLWKDVAREFEREIGVKLKSSALQRRYRRIPQKYHVLAKRSVRYPLLTERF